MCVLIWVIVADNFVIFFVVAIFEFECSFCIIEGPETVQDFAQMQLQEIQENIRSRRNKIFLHMEEASLLLFVIFYDHHFYFYIICGWEQWILYLNQFVAFA